MSAFRQDSRLFHERSRDRRSVTSRADEPISWGVLGTGRIAETFIAAVKGVEGAEVRAVGSRTLERARGFGERFGIPEYYGNYEQLASASNLDVIYVATPHSAHKDAVILCLNAKKAVLCEKPFAINAIESRLMVDCARSNKVFLMEAMWTRFNPAIQAACRMIKLGDIGSVCTVTAAIGWPFEYDPHGRLYDPNLGGGALLDVGVYGVSLALHILGLPVAVKACASRAPSGVDGQTAVLMAHGSGRLSILSCTIEGHSAGRMSVVGTEGLVEIESWFNPSSFVVRSSGNTSDSYEFPIIGNGMEYEIKEVNRCIRAGHLESQVMPLQDSLDVMSVLDQIRMDIGLSYPEELRCSNLDRNDGRRKLIDDVQVGSDTYGLLEADIGRG